MIIPHNDFPRYSVAYVNPPCSTSRKVQNACNLRKLEMQPPQRHLKSTLSSTLRSVYPTLQIIFHISLFIRRLAGYSPLTVLGLICHKCLIHFFCFWSQSSAIAYTRGNTTRTHGLDRGKLRKTRETRKFWAGARWRRKLGLGTRNSGAAMRPAYRERGAAMRQCVDNANAA